MCLPGGVRLGYVTRLRDGLKKLTSLEVLHQVVVMSGCIAEELGHLTQLRVLDVRSHYLHLMMMNGQRVVKLCWNL